MLPRLLLLILLTLAGCASAPPPEPSHVLPVQGTRLDNQISKQAAAHPGQSGFHLLASSVDAFLARAELIRKAQRSLDIQYYIVHDGLTTRALIRELLHAADRGVRVRILIDDTSSDGWDYELGALAAHPKVRAKVTVEVAGSCRNRGSRTGSSFLALSVSIFACSAAPASISKILPT